MKIIIDPEGVPSSEQELAALKLLLKDALGEFVAARTPPEQYVNQRYADHSDPWRERKLAEVRGRLVLAEKLKAADFWWRQFPRGG